MIELWPILTAALITGLLGSAHCFGMCGGISGLFAAGADSVALRNQFSRAAAYNMGRVLTYALLGSTVAFLGKTAISSLPDLAAPVRLAGGLLIILVGLQVAFGWRTLAVVERAGAKLWRNIAPTAKSLVPVTSTGQALGLGLIWGFLPCGLVYSVLLIAASSAEPLAGALVMMSFGVGTMPSMVATGVGASQLARFMSRNRIGAGLLIVMLGLATIAMPVMSVSQTGDTMQHQHRTNHSSDNAE